MQPAVQTFVRRCGWLSLVTAGLWLVVVGPAYGMTGRNGVEDVSIFAIFCLLPGWLVFWLVSRYGVATCRKTNAPAFAVLAGTGLRMIFGGLAIFLVISRRGQVENATLYWLALFYVVTLMVETFLVVKPEAVPPETD